MNSYLIFIKTFNIQNSPIILVCTNQLYCMFGQGGGITFYTFDVTFLFFFLGDKPSFSSSNVTVVAIYTFDL